MGAGAGREDQGNGKSVPWLGVDTLTWPTDQEAEGFSVPA